MRCSAQPSGHIKSNSASSIPCNQGRGLIHVCIPNTLRIVLFTWQVIKKHWLNELLKNLLPGALATCCLKHCLTLKVNIYNTFHTLICLLTLEIPQNSVLLVFGKCFIELFITDLFGDKYTFKCLLIQVYMAGRSSVDAI
jgi:hypothetical protein